VAFGNNPSSEFRIIVFGQNISGDALLQAFQPKLFLTESGQLSVDVHACIFLSS
jgi:hypothetical protein